MKNSFIGLMTADTPALPLGFLGILKSGNIIVPVNPVFPDNRIHFIINDCNIKVLITDDIYYSRAVKIAKSNPSLRHLLCIDSMTLEVSHERLFTKGNDMIAVQGAARDRLCYIIYTSGSTGKPKGVPITHKNLVPLLLWFGNYFGLDKDTVVLHNLSYTFDFGVFEILTTFVFGGRMYILDRRSIGDLSIYAEFIISRAVNTFHTTPAFLSNMITAGKKMTGLKILHLGGEKLTHELIRRVSRLVSGRCKLYNGYGPTEATINCSIFCITPELRAGSAVQRTIPIGRPSAGHMLYILDKYRQPVPIGVAGELCIGGNSTAAGYLNHPELTAEKFGTRLYRTGDLARWLPDGNIDFLGRIDNQVKMRGFRIELGEIENRLLKHDQIKETVVILKEDEEIGKYLCAYFISEKEIAKSELKQYLADKLPDYMVPSYFIRLRKFPLNASGKVDAKALPAPEFEDAAEGYTPPGDEVEKKLAGLWQQILGDRRIGLYDNFFEIGGQSILAMKLISLIKETFNVKIPLIELFRTATIKGISKIIKDSRTWKSSLRTASSEALIQPFDVTKAPLFRVKAVSLPGGSCMLYLDIHPIISGEISTETIKNEFFRFYKSESPVEFAG